MNVFFLRWDRCNHILFVTVFSPLWLDWLFILRDSNKEDEDNLLLLVSYFLVDLIFFWWNKDTQYKVYWKIYFICVFSALKKKLFHALLHLLIYIQNFQCEMKIVGRLMVYFVGEYSLRDEDWKFSLWNLFKKKSGKNASVCSLLAQLN